VREVDDHPALPRELIFLGSLWLVGSWFVSIGVRPPLHPSASSYTPGVRAMLICVMIGLVIAWPLMRLSSPPTRWPFRRTLLDLVTLLLLAQVIVWPVRLVTTWSVERTFAISLFVIGWTTIAGAVVAIATSHARHLLVTRTAAMLFCCALCIVGPAIAWAMTIWADLRGGGHVWDGELAPWLGPMVGLHALTGGGTGSLRDGDWRSILIILLAGLCSWGAASILALRHRPPAAGTTTGRSVSSL